MKIKRWISLIFIIFVVIAVVLWSNKKQDSIYNTLKKIVNDFNANPNYKPQTLLLTTETTIPILGDELTILPPTEKSQITVSRQPTLPLKKRTLCTGHGSKLVGPLFVDTSPVGMEELEQSIENVDSINKGGWFQPVHCKAKRKVAVIIPFRKRASQLTVFLRHMHPLLMRQELTYRIIVVEQLDDDAFNRATLFNAGFVEAMKMFDFDCVIFHDVDLIPEDDHNYYGCPTSPRHMSAAVDKFDYKMLYETLFGGVSAFLTEHFKKINGFSNLFFGWGGEDDDLYKRIIAKGYKLSRPSMEHGRYKMLKENHFQSSDKNPNRVKLLESSVERMPTDGLSSLKYELSAIDELPLVTFVRVKISPSMYALVG